MTSLIDVIFLLLLFFMLTSTFSRYSEVELTAATSGTTAPSDLPPLFLQLHPDRVALNGVDVVMQTLSQAVADTGAGTAHTPQTLLVSMTSDVSAQRLTDLLAALRNTAAISVTVLGASG
ncbi:biopolymer transporter ExbD [Tateyamaria sp. SN6-1]|uniref:biopolymer transporter ExbD n=1 Tax=Tateyamaria sp. SN6-1 TaxID=3092148 RepID=UPI0039F574AE